MATEQTSAISQHPDRPMPREGATLTDGQLLGRFLDRRDEAAFAALVSRHGPMVWGVCRRLLCNHQDAEDAFQATFLVLVRKAASIVPREMVANWLYGVAYQTALKARATTGRRRARERQVVQMPEPEAAEPDLWSDLQPLLDQELSRLPEKYRVPVVLCDLEGKTHKEAARQLGCPAGTLSARLARARALLAKRLARRGVAVSVGVLAAVLSQQAAPAAVPLAAVSATIKTATLFAAGKAAAAGVTSARAVALMEGVLKAMLLTKLRGVIVLLAAILLAGAVVLVAYGVLHAAQPGSDAARVPGSEEFTDLQARGEGPKQPAKADPLPEPKLPKVTTRGGAAGPESFDQALEWMRGDNQASQLIAIGSLARLEAPFEPRREEVTAQLEKMLNGRDRLVASKCADALYVWATRKQVPSLITSLEDPFCRKSAMQTLGKLKDDRAVEPLARFLKSERTADREPAAAALVALGPVAEKEVREYLTDPNQATRDEAARVLKQLGKTDRDGELDAALAGLTDRNALARKKALAWFDTADPTHPRREEAARALAGLVKGGDLFARQGAIAALCRWGSRQDVPVLLDALKETMLGIPNNTLIIKTLGKWGDERALPVLGELLATGSPFESDAAVEALVQLGPRGEAEALKHLDSNRLQTKEQVCRVLKEAGTRASLKPLQAEIDRANREQYPGYQTVVTSCQAALKKLQERAR
jgi:RNA polymerase sigma factor (sigma-70 family)